MSEPTNIEHWTLIIIIKSWWNQSNSNGIASASPFLMRWECIASFIIISNGEKKTIICNAFDSTTMYSNIASARIKTPTKAHNKKSYVKKCSLVYHINKVMYYKVFRIYLSSEGESTECYSYKWAPLAAESIEDRYHEKWHQNRHIFSNNCDGNFFLNRKKVA